MRTRKLTVFPNPYAHIDANGRLAGAAPVGELPRKTSVMPVRAYVGAKLEVLDHDTRDRGPQFTQLSRAEYRFLWGAEPVEVDASGQLDAFYRQLDRDGELFILSSKTPQPPLEKLARARTEAILRYRAEQNHAAECPKLTRDGAECDCIANPDASEWAEQFPLDHDVAAAAELLAERDAEVAKAAQVASDKANADAKAISDKAAAEQAKSAEERRAGAKARARIALGIETVPVAASMPATAPDVASTTASDPDQKPSTPRRQPAGSKES